MPSTSNIPKFNPNERLTLSHGCLILDRNIPECREYLFGGVTFTEKFLSFEFSPRNWPFNVQENYFEKEFPTLNDKVTVTRMVHQYSYRGIKFVMRLDEYNFVVCGSRQDVPIRFQDNIGAENFFDTLLAYQVGSKLVWHKVFESPRDRRNVNKDQLLDPSISMQVREDFETVSAVSRLIGGDSWGHYVSTQKALQKNVLTYWINYRHHQDSLGPQVGLAKDLARDKSNFEMMLKIANIIKQDLEANIETMRGELDDHESSLDTILTNFKLAHPIYDETKCWTATEREVRYIKVPFINTRGTHSLSDLRRLNAQNQRVELVEVEEVEEEEFDENDANYDWTKGV